MKFRDEAESNQNKQQKQQLKRERNIILNKLRNQLKFEKTSELDEELKEVEAYKDYPSKCYQAMRSRLQKAEKSNSKFMMTVLNLSHHRKIKYPK